MAALPAGPDRTRRQVRLRPLGVGLILLAALSTLVGLATRETAVWITTLALLGAVVSDVLVARMALAQARPEVTGPSVALAGEAVPHMVRVATLTQPLVLHRPAGWAQPQLTVGLGTTGPVSLLLEATVRGVTPDLVLDLVAAGPLGLGEAVVRHRAWRSAPLAVVPAPMAHDPDWPRPRTSASDESVSVARGESLYRGVRPYRRGDPRRWVHWPATAHHGTLMVKELDGLEHVNLRVVVDLPAPGPASDAAVARAGWLLDQAVGRGWHVHLVTTEAPALDPVPLGRPLWPMAAVAPNVTSAATRTVVRRVDRIGQARPQLAAAGFGAPALDPWDGMTRLVSPEGDRWL